MPEFREKYDVCIIGAGHAGCEAALLPVPDLDLKQLFLQSVLKV